LRGLFRRVASVDLRAEVLPRVKDAPAVTGIVIDCSLFTMPTGMETDIVSDWPKGIQTIPFNLLTPLPVSSLMARSFAQLQAHGGCARQQTA
jgi:hypothetical protein